MGEGETPNPSGLLTRTQQHVPMIVYLTPMLLLLRGKDEMNIITLEDAKEAIGTRYVRKTYTATQVSGI
jgi:hypothetical protein